MKCTCWGWYNWAKMDMQTHTRDFVVIDGSYGEGGGQIVRVILALSMLTGKPFEIRNIRARRPNPGLQPQHLTAVYAAATLAQARVEGAYLGSSTLRFIPGAIEGGEFLFNVEEISGTGSAGSVLLVAQTVLVPLALSGQSATLRLLGGTHVGWSPGADYVKYVYLPALREMGIEADLHIEYAGFYPKGGGMCTLRVKPAEAPPQPIEWLDRGTIQSIKVITTISNLPDHIVRRGDETAETFIGLTGLRPEFIHHFLPSRGYGVSLTLAVKAERGYAGFIRLGRRGVAIEQVVEEAWNEFVAWAKTRTAVDHFLADQLLVPAVFATGPSTWTTPKASSHLRTVLWLLPKFAQVGLELTRWGEQGVQVRVIPGGEGVVGLNGANDFNHTST